MTPVVANDRDDAGGEARRWIMRLASGASTAEDLRRLDIWLNAAPENRDAFRRERQSWQDLTVLEEAFASVGTSGSPDVRRRLPRRMAVGLGLAACFATAWFMPGLLLYMQADYAAPRTHASAITLADGSKAVLDAGSALSVDFDREARSITLLKGKAWFDVRHGDARPFRVHAGNGVTQDVGTAFAVEEAEDGVRVGVTEGSAIVSGAAGVPLSLAAGGQATYRLTGPAQKLARIDPDMIGNWRRGEILVRAQPVATAIAEISRYRSAPIFIWGDLSALPPVSGSFRTDRPDEALDTLIIMRGLERISLPGGIAIVRAAKPK